MTVVGLVKVGLVLYSKVPVSGVVPFGSTVPLSVAAVDVILDAGSLVTTTGSGVVDVTASTVDVPVDVIVTCDIAEEVARITGYDKVKGNTLGPK